MPLDFKLRHLFLFCGASLSFAAPASAQGPRGTKPIPLPSSKAAPDLSASPDDTVSVIVQYVSGPSAAELQQLSSLGASTIINLRSINAVQVQLPASALQALSSDGNVRYISPDRNLVTHAVPGGPAAPIGPVPSGAPAGPGQSNSIATSPEFTAEPINAPAVWSQGFYGTGIGVAVVDSGITMKPDLQTNSVGGSSPTQKATGPNASGRIVYSACFLPGCTSTNDQYGHGTHVAGLIGGNGAASYGAPFSRTFFGIAPNVKFVNLKVLDSNGQGTDTAVIQAIEAAIALKDVYNIRVINLSLGRPIFESYTLDPLCQAAEQAWKAGITVVAAAGNDGRNLALNGEGYGTIEAPGNDPYVLTVGAVRTNGTAAIADDAMASYSSKGPSYIDHLAKPDVLAPGNLVTSLEAPGNMLQQNNPTFFTPVGFYRNAGGPAALGSSPDYMPLSGTSMATGVTSGAVALLLSANPALTPDQVKALVMIDANKSVLPQTSSVSDGGVTYVAHNDVLTQGAGYLDIGAAVRDAKSATFPQGFAMSPLAVYDPSSGSVGLVSDATALWGRTALWGASNLYGSSAFVGGNTALWGRSTVPDGSTALWGRANDGSGADPNGASQLWGSTALWGRDDPQAYTALWGTTALWGRSTPEASTALWGRSSMDGSSALWGSSTLSGTTALWG